jgi:hypothetical protein
VPNSRACRRAGAGLATAALALAAGAAHARTETIRWTYSEPARAAGFRIYLGPDAATFPASVDVGSPTPSGGIYSATISLGDSELAWSVVTALDATGGESGYSNARRLDPPAVEPPPDPGDGGGGGGSGDGATGPAIWTNRFENVAAGADPPGWLDTAPRNSMAEDDGLFSVKSVGGTRAFATSDIQPNIHSHYVTDASRGWSRYELRGRLRISDASAGIGVTILSQYPRADAYYRILRHYDPALRAFQMSPHPDGRPIACASASSGVVPGANAWYRFRFQASPEADGTYLRAKLWADGSAEPRAWQIDCVDRAADRLTRGAPGVWSAGRGTKYWDDLEVVPLDAGGQGGSGGGGLAVPAAPSFVVD